MNCQRQIITFLYCQDWFLYMRMAGKVFYLKNTVATHTKWTRILFLKVNVQRRLDHDREEPVVTDHKHGDEKPA